MSETSTLIGYNGRTIGREELTLVPTPLATETHRPVPHHEIVQALIETLGFRHIGVVHDEYARCDRTTWAARWLHRCQVEPATRHYWKQQTQPFSHLRDIERPSAGVWLSRHDEVL